MSVADGENRKTACPRGVSSHQSCSTSTLMISHLTTERVASYTQTIYVSAQYSSFTEVERTIRDALNKPTQYYRSNSLRANPDETQLTAFHLNTPQSIKKVVKFKMGSECKCNQTNSIGIRILCGRIRSNSVGEITSRPETEYGTKQCMQRRHRMSETNQCRDLYLLAGIAPPDIRRAVCARMEKTKQGTNEAHSLYGQHPAGRRLKSRNCFLRSVKPAEFPP